MLCGISAKSQMAQTESAPEPHRPQIHFTPQNAWMNDPNGMVYYNGTYHLFYQHYPDSTVWGPMHWGHATSRDLMHWEHQPIALYPDSLGFIFSGSAVADVHNTSGFGRDGKVPLVAIFTHHSQPVEFAGRSDYENQSIAYSLDEGKTWTKYAGNPVVKNPGIKDFRDPKVMWHEESKKWIMTLATLDRITFYSSSNLKDWTKESEFGKDYGAHGGVWECPDLFSLNYAGKEIWVLTISLNPGGPNGGSATQYFTGTFDGHRFTPFQTDTRWVDYGPDNYAGVTWSNTGKRKIMLGWMSNWQYAALVPTENWRGATTIPRDLSLQKIGEKYFLASRPVKETEALALKPVVLNNLAAGNVNLTAKIGNLTGPARMDLSANRLESFSIVFSNSKGQKLMVGYDKSENNYFIDRTASGKTDFEKGFARKHVARRIATTGKFDMTLIIDNASVEVFADNGLSVLTGIFFPDEEFTDICIRLMKGFVLNRLRFSNLKPL